MRTHRGPWVVEIMGIIQLAGGATTILGCRDARSLPYTVHTVNRCWWHPYSFTKPWTIGHIQYTYEPHPASCKLPGRTILSSEPNKNLWRKSSFLQNADEISSKHAITPQKWSNCQYVFLLNHQQLIITKNNIGLPMPKIKTEFDKMCKAIPEFWRDKILKMSGFYRNWCRDITVEKLISSFSKLAHTRRVLTASAGRVCVLDYTSAPLGVCQGA